MTTNQTERVSDEELDQMIWKLERDGMTPKQLSLMRELREVRRAKGEPVARELQEHHEAVSTPIYQLFDMGWYDTNKQTHDNAVSAGCAGRIVYTAPPAPVSVPAAMEMDDDFDSAFEHGKAVGWNACRAAMLQGADGTLTNEGTIPVTQFNPVADLYGLTSPTGGETSFTFDAVEARDFIDGGWSCQEYVELGRFQEAMLQNGNSPAQSDCCPEQNYIAPAQDGDYPVIPDGWIPVSERMPGSQEWVIVFAKWDNQQVLCWDDVANRWTDFEDQSYYADMFTHWMPLPAAPQQEVK